LPIQKHSKKDKLSHNGPCCVCASGHNHLAMSEQGRQSSYIQLKYLRRKFIPDKITPMYTVYYTAADKDYKV